MDAHSILNTLIKIHGQTIYNAIYSIAEVESENDSTFLMHENTLRALMSQRIAKNKAGVENNDDNLYDIDEEYI